MRKKVGIITRVACLGLIFLLSINSFAAIVSDNDGSAFITKAEFDALKSSFQAQIDTYNQSIDSKIDGAIASYLAGIRISNEISLPFLFDTNYQLPLAISHNGKFQATDRSTRLGMDTTLIRENNSNAVYKSFTIQNAKDWGVITEPQFTTLTAKYAASDSFRLIEPDFVLNLVRVRYDYDGALSWLSGNSSVINGENSFLIRGMFKDANYRIIGTAYQGGTGQKYFQVASQHAVGGIGVTRSGNSSTGYKYSIKEVIVNHVDSLNFTIPDGTGSPTIDNLDTVTVADFNGSHAFLTGTGDSTTNTLKMLLTSTSTSNNSDMEKISDIAAYDTDEYFIGYQQSQQADHLYFAGRSGQIYSWLPDVTSSVVSSNFNGLAASHSTGWVPSLIDWYKVLWPVWTIDNGVAGANVTTNASIDARGSLHAKYIYHDLKTQGSGVLKHNLASGLPLVEMEQKGTLSAKFTFAANGTENYEMTALRSEPLPTSIKVYFSKTPYKGITEWQSHLDDMLPTQINNSGVYNKVNTIVNNGTPFTIKIQNLEAKDIVYMFWCDANDPDSMVCQGILKKVEDLVEVVDT